ncbi:hydrogenase-2 operon protein HybG [Enterobacter hormaechei]|uniref:Hydrogenase maturation factor HybG n=1 Tax=Phytobacter ursingii TaxID=1972431 RepID=A0AB35RK03_9ENTR|nr:MULTISPECIES: hydrogenase maturation factor HybG [Enterobacteriaceae]MDV2862441.1 hydrogenase maturation factor HybG [Phytobacter ursingii]GJL37512.1 hydrogenase-2 operon protein HybG [Enterobacter hormaechei]
MCIGVPGQVVSVGESVHHLAQVDVCGVRRDVNIMLVCESEPTALLGQWVLVHVGFAMSVIDEQEALATLEALRELDMDFTEPQR